MTSDTPKHLTGRGLFITFEGPDGSGKSTQARMLAERLRADGYAVLESVEPGGTAVGQQIRSILLDPANQELHSVAELLLMFACRAQNVEEWILPALAEGKIALVLSFEGCEPVGRNVELLTTFWRLGLRICAFTWNRRTALADGSDQDGTGAGLTREGQAALAEFERLGVLLDVTHLSHAGVAHVLNLATRPVIASHSNARALCETQRNLSDDDFWGNEGDPDMANHVATGKNLPLFTLPEDGTYSLVIDHKDADAPPDRAHLELKFANERAPA